MRFHAFPPIYYCSGKFLHPLWKVGSSEISFWLAVPSTTVGTRAVGKSASKITMTSSHAGFAVEIKDTRVASRELRRDTRYGRGTSLYARQKVLRRHR